MSAGATTRVPRTGIAGADVAAALATAAGPTEVAAALDAGDSPARIAQQPGMGQHWELRSGLGTCTPLSVSTSLCTR